MNRRIEILILAVRTNSKFYEAFEKFREVNIGCKVFVQENSDGGLRPSRYYFGFKCYVHAGDDCVAAQNVC